MFLDGADPTKNANGLYGQGVYFAKDKSVAEDYASNAFNEGDGTISKIIAAKLFVAKPFVTNSFDMMGLVGNLDFKSQNIANYLKAKGYDSIYLKGEDYLISFDKAQVVSYSNTKHEG